ncbi:hypothetical protein BDQ17DRAFT_1020541 [Cyathus striatus]|nr:hypothetical protein BDQ17DRAFT_1020541 [Cyathus striatus]
MWFKKSLILLFFISAIYAHPLERRANTKPSSSTTSASQTSKSSTKPTSTSSTTKSTSTSSAKLTTSAKLTSSSRITSTSTTLTLKPTSIPASNVTSLQPLFDGNQKSAQITR